MPAEVLPPPRPRLVASDSPPVRKTGERRPVKIFKSPLGKTLIDFGQNLVGKLQIRLPSSGKDGHRVSFRHAEVLENGELGTRTLRDAKPVDSIILSRKQQSIGHQSLRFTDFAMFKWMDGRLILECLVEKTLLLKFYIVICGALDGFLARTLS